MNVLRILIADSDAESRQRFSETFRDGGCTVDAVSTAQELLEKIRAASYDLLFLDMEPRTGNGGPGLLREIKREHPSTLVVLTSAAATPETVISGFRAGAYDYLLKPIPPAKLRELAGRAQALRAMGEQRRQLSEQLEHERLQVMELKRRLASAGSFEGIMGSSVVMRDLVKTLQEVARTESTVLLTGESGTGKSLVARAIHEASDRAGGPFVEANCVVYSEGVLHSELFGHEKGAFTGAARQKKGRFEMACGGTLFLDEIGEISQATQLLLLRVLQDRTFERVGGETTLEAEVRLIAATNRDLQEAMRRGDFRSDLFFRLNVIPVHMPSLREHPEDVPALAQHFLHECAARLGRPAEGFTTAGLDALIRYRWPGNIRELENVVERMVVLSRSARIDVGDLPPTLRELRESASPGGATGTLQELEYRRIREVLWETGGNKKLTAERLGIHRSTLYAKLRRYGLLEQPVGPPGRRETGQDAPENATQEPIPRAVGS